MTKTKVGWLFAVVIIAITTILSVTATAAPSKGARGPNVYGSAPSVSHVPVTTASYQTSLEFSSAYDTHVFTAILGKGAAYVTASTQDCCIPGDHWGVFLIRYNNTPLGIANPSAAKCGTGNASAFTGAVSLAGAALNRSIQVVVVHCSGVATFPADLTFQLQSNVPMTVTRRT